jgi:hypothetical protein
MTNGIKKELASLRVEPHWIQATTEEGERHHVQSGWVVVALVDGTHRFELQSVFTTEDAANAKVNNLCGNVSNGFTALIDTSSSDAPHVKGYTWQYTGSSR